MLAPRMPLKKTLLDFGAADALDFGANVVTPRMQLSCSILAPRMQTTINYPARFRRRGCKQLSSVPLVDLLTAQIEAYPCSIHFVIKKHL
jgi:hypothetical protein